MSERERFNMLLSPEQKDQWEEYADDNPNVDSLSHLVRLAVQKEMAGRAAGGGGGASEEVGEELSELVEENRQLNNRLERMEARLGSIEQAVQEDPKVSKLANDVFAVLPTKDQVEDDDLPARIPEEQGGPVANSGRVADVAALLDTSELMAQKALDKLQADTARVQDTDGGRYYKEV